MRRLGLYITILAVVALVATTAFSPVREYALGASKAETLTSDNDTVEITPSKSITVYTLATDTNTFVVNAASFAVPGAQMVFIISASDTTTVKFDTGIEGANVTVKEGKTSTVSFISNGSAWYNTGTIQVN